MKYTALTKEFYLNDTLPVAKALLGKYLIRQTESGRICAKITEAEGYIGRIDKASHAYNYKKTERTKIMFETGGIAYVYFIYGMYYCLNVVTEKEGEPCAVLIRGAEISEGLDIASQLRYGEAYENLTKAKIKNMSNGPGKLCKALNITKGQNSISLLEGELIIAEKEGASDTTGNITASKRIGIDYAEEAADFLWRFELKE